MRRRRLALGAAIAASIASASAAKAQSAATSSDTMPAGWNGWLSLALGPAATNTGTRLGGDIALWLTRGPLALGVHDAGASRVVEPGDFYDLSVLAGVHPRSEAHFDVVAGAGVGIGRGHTTSGANVRTEPVITAGAQLSLNYHVIGVAIDGFATAGSSRWYYGVGLAVGAGWFR